jgi:hypothetical protein
LSRNQGAAVFQPPTKATAIWKSPLLDMSKARIRFKFPSGEETLEIVDIRYE